MDKSSSQNPNIRPVKSSSGRERRLQKRWRINAFLQGVKVFAITVLLTLCPFPLGAYPLGVVLLCATTQLWPYVLAGVMLAGCLPLSPLPLGGMAILCLGVMGLRLFFGLAVDKPPTKVPKESGQPSLWQTMQEILWGTNSHATSDACYNDTVTDYYDGKKNIPVPLSPTQTQESPPPVAESRLFSERMVYRLLVSSLGGFGLGLYGMIMGGFAVYDLLSALLMTVLCPLLTYLLFHCFSQSGQALLTFGTPPASAGQASADRLLQNHKPIVLISGLSLLFFCAYAARNINLTLITPYLTLRLAPILATLLTLRTTSRYGMIPGIAVGVACGLGADALFSPALILGAVAYGFLRFLSHRAGVIGGSLAGLLWVLLGSGSQQMVAYLPSMLLVPPLCLALDKLSHHLPTPENPASSLPLHDFSASVSQKTRAEAHIQRLEALSGAFSSLSKLFYDLSGDLRHPKLPELQKMCDEVFDRHCDRCHRREICDKNPASHPSDTLSPAMARQLYNMGKLDISTLPASGVSGCVCLEAILADVSSRCARMTEQLLRSEKTEVFATDYQAISDLIRDTLTHDEAEFRCNREAADRIGRYLTSLGVEVYGVVVCGVRSCQIYARGSKFDTTDQGIRTLWRGLEEVMDMRLTPPGFTPEGGHTLLHLTATPAIKTVYAGSTVPAGTAEDSPLPSPLTNEKDQSTPYAPPATCGDHIAMFQNGHACFYALISDGMGSGAEASLTSEICAMFLEKMLSAGNSVELSIRMLNSFIRQKNSGSGEECSATVDLLALDLMSGQAIFAKNGAAPTYVVRDEHVYKLKSRTLPIGILKDSEPRFLKFRMHPGDVVVMVSDGVTLGNDECPWLMDLLADPLPASMDDLRLDILRSALASGSPDDLSAIAIRIQEEE